jgi:homogentisate 1,2-dioxygenase
VIPKGVIWKIDAKDDLSCLLVESKGPIEVPTKYTNRFGQLMEHSPFCERDIVTPTFQEPVLKSGVELKIRLEDGIQNYILKNHPFDIVGWDGFYYPWKLNINDFEPITGSIHQPPPVHQTFQSNGFVICSFVSRLFDFHPDAIPSPYPHSNVDSDEVIFYSMGDFMSRNGIEEESITLHPAGITHGPHPGKYEGSIGKKETRELAVMIDTFKPLSRSKGLDKIEDEKYSMSWNS